MDSAELIDMIANDAPSHEVSDAIKSIIYQKAANMVDTVTPDVAADLFGDEVPEEEPVDSGIEPEANAEVEQEPQEEDSE
tara:strand:- start:42 stop:281 length:240 start_codon:yes stop_codon:yes gene_type:complete